MTALPHQSLVAQIHYAQVQAVTSEGPLDPAAISEGCSAVSDSAPPPYSSLCLLPF